MTLRGKTLLITGSTDGVGRLVAQKLAAAGAHVLVHGRSGERAASLVDAIRDKGGTADAYLADLSSLAEVRRLAEAILRDCPRLDGLVNNAGIGTGAPATRRETSAEGHELRFAVNYLSGFLLTRLLLPLLRQSAPATVVNVSSAGQRALDFSDLMLEKGYSGMRAYMQSKLAQVMFTLDLAEELGGTGVAVNCLHPASYMDTAMVRESGIAPMSSLDDGADAIIHLAVACGILRQSSGQYFDGLRPARADASAYDLRARQRLRDLSLRLCGLPPLAAR